VKKEFFESPFPFGIGGSFLASLFLLVAGGAALQLLALEFLQVRLPGAAILLVIVSAVMVGPWLYNRRPSRFQEGREVQRILDGFGTVPGLRGAFIRLLLYADGLEARVFYHRCFVPFRSGPEFSLSGGRLRIVTVAAGFPEVIAMSEGCMKEFHRELAAAASRAKEGLDARP
jgi:hypothetical protein